MRLPLRRRRSRALLTDGASVAIPGAPTAAERLGPLGSARIRIIASFAILLLLAAVVSMFAIRELLNIRLDQRIKNEHAQEVLELDRLVRDGRDPETGKPFSSLQALFGVFFARNVPGKEEALLAFVDGDLQEAALERYPVPRIPNAPFAEWRRLSTGGGAAEPDVTGRFGTEEGEARYRASPVRFSGDSGTFVVTSLPAGELEEIGEIQTYGVIVGITIVLLAAGCAWLVAGRALAPVRQLTETAQTISQSDLTQRIEVRGSDEAAHMARSFNAMLDRLEGVFRSQREFVRDASHELRDPLTICLGHLQMLEAAQSPEEREATAAVVTDELVRMGRIVDDLQRLAEAEQRDFLQPELLDAGLLAHELVVKASALAPRDWQLESADEGEFRGDRHRLTEAVMNLAHNAVQHTRDHDVIAIGVGLAGGEARISVRDSGTGISAEDQARIFDRFARGSAARRLYRGGGLGLAIVRVIAEAHGGRVELQSRLGEGSTFTIVVPRGLGGGLDGPDIDR